MNSIPFDVSGLILEVQHKPEFDTRVGKRDLDIVGNGHVHGLWHVRMSVNVKNAPDLIERLPSPLSCLTIFVTFALDGYLDERPGDPSVTLVDFQSYPMSMFALPVTQVACFGCGTFGENEQLKALRSARNRPCEVPRPPWHS